MKKVLFATTAIVAAGLIAGAAQAAEPIKIGISGYHEQWVGFASNDDYNNTVDYTSVDVKQDAEFKLSGSTKLDNGLTITTVFELEAAQGEDTGDETYITISSDSMGTVKIGSDDSLANALHHGADSIDVGISYGDVDLWIVNTGMINNDGSSYNWGTGEIATDEQHISYTTPNFNGFAFAVEYAPDAMSSNGNRSGGDMPNSKGGAAGAWVVAGVYEGEFSGVSVGVDAGYVHQMNGLSGENGVSAVQAGLKLGIDNWTVAGGYARADENQGAGATVLNGHAWDVGVSYATGPYAVSATYFYETWEGQTDVAKNDNSQTILLSGKYVMGPGVELRASGFWANYDEEGNTSATENDGMGLVGGFRLTF